MKERKYLESIGAWECEQNTPHHLYTVGEHTEKVVAYCIDHGAGEELIRAAWLHDAGKMRAKYNDGKYDRFSGHPAISAEIAEELGESKYVVDLIKYHDSHRDKNIDFADLAKHGKQWCDDLAILLMADVAGQDPVYHIGEKLQKRGTFLINLYAALGD